MMYSIIVLILLLLFSIAYYKYAQKINIIDTPNHRSSHTSPTIRGGGIIFFMAIVLYVIMYGQIDDTYFLTGFLFLSILGFIDDKKELSAKIRFPFQLIAVGFILYDAGLFTSEIPLLLQILGFIVGVGFVNAFNFMDGINGITGFYTIAVLGVLWYLNQKYPIFSQELFINLFLAITVFGFYNFRKKALMFAGDIGSMALASVLLFMIAKMMIQLQSPIIILAVLVYGIDSAMTIIYRIYLKEKIAEAHRHHIYQKLVDVNKWSHLKVSGVYAFIQLIIGTMLVKYVKAPLSTQVLISILALFSGVVFYGILQWCYKNNKNIND